MSFLSKVIPKTGIKVAFIDSDGKKVSGVTVDQANKVAELNPDKTFYFQNGDGLEEELSINEVNELLPTNLLPTAPACPTGPQVCGPPLVRFFGGGGTGANANAIISPISSSIIGFDIIDSGFSYFGSPSAELIDPCGKGSGSKLQVNMDDDDEDTAGEGDGTSIEEETAGTGGTGTGGGIDPCKAPKVLFEKSTNKFRNRSKKIKNITILAPGDGYLSAPDGSLGGSERVWKEPDEGYVETKCGGYFTVQPYRPIKVSKGDTYYPPDGPPRVLEEDEIITLPLVPVTPPRPEGLGQTYPVLLFIEEIKVIDPGFGYRPGDKLIINGASADITSSNGASAELIVNEDGSIGKVEVTNPGIGFLDLPSLRTNSPTGFNATFSTILRPVKIDITRPVEEQLKNIEPFKQLSSFVVPDQLKLITVIDCVGKV
jgi:hypothetical protein